MYLRSLRDIAAGVTTAIATWALDRVDAVLCRFANDTDQEQL